MFGRIRASPPSPAELLELELLPSKLFKDDSLSIYESTLVKLKQGAQRRLRPASQDTDLEGLSKVTGLCSEQGLRAFSSSGASVMGVPSSPSLEHHNKGIDLSIHYLFSKYAASHLNGRLH